MQKSQWLETLKLLTKTDIVIISLILLSGVLSFLYTLFCKSQTNQVIIHHDNTIFCVENLNKNAVIPVNTVLQVEILHGKARIVHSTCKNLICERMGWSNSQPIICVPNKVYLEFPKSNGDEIFITH